MDPGVIGGLIALSIVVAGAALWRAYAGDRSTPEDALHADELARERDRQLTDASEAVNRYNLRPPGR